MKKRNGLIDLEKFLFALIIALFHAGYFYNDDISSLCVSGFIAVEFYFMVSGYLLAQKAKNYNGNDLWEDNLKQMGHRVSSLFPYLLLAGLTSNLLYVFGSFNWDTLKNNLLLTIVDTFGLQMLGFKGFIATGVSWYISVLFIFSFIFFPVLCRKHQFFSKYIAPITAVMILGYLCYTEAFLDYPGKWLGITFKGVLRGFVDLSFGVMAYEFTTKINAYEESKKNFLALRILEIASIIIMFSYAIFHKGSDIHDFFLVPIICISVAISFSKFSIGRFFMFQKRIFNFLGIFSLSIYLNHYYVTRNLPRLFPTIKKTNMLFIYLIIVIFLSIGNYVIGKKIQKSTRKARAYLIVIVLFLLVCIPVSKSDELMTKIYIMEANFEGEGTQDKPFLINNRTDLQFFSLIVNSGETYENHFFLQTNNIDLNNNEWVPIGKFGGGSYFRGIYNGGNHYISNILVSDKIDSNIDNNGFFGLLEGTVINFGIESGNISGDCVGSIASHGENHATIINCYNKAKISGNVRAGGICDNFGNGKVICCVNYGSVNANDSFAEIVSYDASEIIATFPTKNAKNNNYSGKYKQIDLLGETTSEKLNSGILSLRQANFDFIYEISLWK